MLHETTKKFMEGFRYNAHPMAMLVSTVAALVDGLSGSKKHSGSRQSPATDQATDREDASIAAMSYRHSLGFPYVYPDNDLSYTENFMNMLWKMVEPKIRGQSGTGSRARYTVHPARGSRTELQHQRHASVGSAACRSLPGHRRGRRRSGRATARRSK